MRRLRSRRAARTTPRRWLNGGNGLEDGERRALLALPVFARSGFTSDSPFSDRLRDVLLEALFASGSNILILPLQDIFGWRDRVNVPAVVDRLNWTWRLPAPLEDVVSAPAALERAAFLRSLSEKHGRSSA